MLLTDACRITNSQTIVKNSQAVYIFVTYSCLGFLLSACFGVIILHKYPVGGRSKVTIVYMNPLSALDQLEC